mmetsp:Transcript_39086/g.92568  ORF Transcript_39086/g.92568 Transcript_39086/m.92568 type:complete len:289 (-) Transcript_39086:187-1053(-)
MPCPVIPAPRRCPRAGPLGLRRGARPRADGPQRETTFVSHRGPASCCCSSGLQVQMPGPCAWRSRWPPGTSPCSHQRSPSLWGMYGTSELERPPRKPLLPRCLPTTSWRPHALSQFLALCLGFVLCCAKRRGLGEAPGSPHGPLPTCARAAAVASPRQRQTQRLLSRQKSPGGAARQRAIPPQSMRTRRAAGPPPAGSPEAAPGSGEPPRRLVLQAPPGRPAAAGGGPVLWLDPLCLRHRSGDNGVSLPEGTHLSPSRSKSRSPHFLLPLTSLIKMTLMSWPSIENIT